MQDSRLEDARLGRRFCFPNGAGNAVSQPHGPPIQAPTFEPIPLSPFPASCAPSRLKQPMIGAQTKNSKAAWNTARL